MEFRSSLQDEQDGLCKALLYADKTFERCDNGTQRKGHHFCYNCWLDLDSVGMADFPPVADEGESRAAIAQRTIFLLDAKQMAQYAAESRHANGHVGGGILVKTQTLSRSWQEKDDNHASRGGTFAVYAIRAGDGSIYVGQTRREPAHRFEEHLRGNGARYLRERGVLGDGPIWSTQVTTRQLALEVEQTIKDVMERLGMRVSVGEPES